MNNYKRSTRECTFEQLQPALRLALHAYFVKNELIDVETQILMCCETRSERQKANTIDTLLGAGLDPFYYLVALLTPEWLVWARGNDLPKTTVVSARLKEIYVRPHASLLVKDIGLEIEGFVDGSFSKVHGYIGLGPEPAAEKFIKAVEQTVETVHPRRRLLDIFGKTPR